MTVHFLAACRRSNPRAEAFEGVVRGALVPAAEAVLQESRALDRALGELLAQPSEPELEQARRALSACLRVWRRASAFRAGPFGESKAFLQAAFWPARPEAIEAVLDGDRPIDTRLVAGLGVDRRGLFALEYLLFGRVASGDRLALSSTSTARVFAYALALGKNVLGYAERLAQMLGDGRAYAAKLERAGQGGIHELVAQTVDGSELLIGKFRRIERKRPGEAPARVVEGYHSQLSRELALELLAGTRALYDTGLGKLVELGAPPVHARVKQRFADAERELRALSQPLDRASLADARAFSACAAALKALELALKLEMANALGVSLVFSGADGD